MYNANVIFIFFVLFDVALYSVLVGTEKIVNCRRICVVLGRLCGESAAARAAALRHLLESALFLSPAGLFGSRRRPIQRLANTPYSLTEENYKLVRYSRFLFTSLRIFSSPESNHLIV